MESELGEGSTFMFNFDLEDPIDERERNSQNQDSGEFNVSTEVSQRNRCNHEINVQHTLMPGNVMINGVRLS